MDITLCNVSFFWQIIATNTHIISVLYKVAAKTCIHKLNCVFRENIWFQTDCVL